MSEAVDTLDKGKKEGIGEFVRKTREELDKVIDITMRAWPD